MHSQAPRLVTSGRRCCRWSPSVLSGWRAFLGGAVDVPRWGDAPRLPKWLCCPIIHPPGWHSPSKGGKEKGGRNPCGARPEADDEQIGIVPPNDDAAESIEDESVEGWIWLQKWEGWYWRKERSRESSFSSYSVFRAYRPSIIPLTQPNHSIWGSSSSSNGAIIVL